MSRKLKVLISAYACEPDRGSEPEVAWALVHELQKFHDVYVITRENNRIQIEDDEKIKGKSNINWLYYDLPKWIKFFKRGNKGVNFYYYFWQWGLLFYVKRLHKINKFDLIHHLTFGRYWTPSFLIFKETPFVLGPVGGGESIPKKLRPIFFRHGLISELMRSFFRMLLEFDPFVLRMLKKASVVFATTEETQRRLECLGCSNIQILPQCGLSQEKIDYFEKTLKKRHENQSMVRFVSIGRHVQWKGFELGIRAFACLQNKFKNCEYWIIGDGPETLRWKNLSNSIVQGERIKFFGKLKTMEEVYTTLASCDVLVHPSMHEAFGYVCLEAMGMGKPVIGLDCGGPGMIIDGNNGFLADVGTPDETTRNLAEKMELFLQDQALITSMGDYARNQVKAIHSWEHRIGKILEIYKKIFECSQKIKCLMY